MPAVSSAMIAVGIAALLAGLILVRTRFIAATGLGKLLVLGPVFEAVALAIFAVEHFLAARDLAPIVPRWLPGALFWTYFFGVALLATAISFLIFRCVRWSAALLALFFLLIVVTVDLPGVPKGLHERLFWTLTVREISFACGALILAASQFPGAPSLAHLARGGIASGRPLTASSPIRILATIARAALAAIFVFYAIEHFLFPHNVPGVPLEKMTPSWMPAPVLISYFTGLTLLAAAPGLLIPRTRRLAAALAGSVLLLLTVFFYIPILLTELHSPLALEGVNYVGDTLLFAATALFAGFDPVQPKRP